MKNKYRMITKIVRNMNLAKTKIERPLNDNEAETLRYITKHNDCIANEIVDYLNVDKALMARILLKLRKEGYIRYEVKEDKRKKYLIALQKAYELKLDTEDYETKYYQSLMVNIPQEEQDIFFNTLEKIYNISKEKRKQNERKV